MIARRLAALFMPAALVALAGCAGLMPVEPPPLGRRAARPDTTSHAAATAGAASAPALRTPGDSLPSAEARDVLNTIPEPLPPGERVPPPAMAQPYATADSTASAAPDSVPVPAETRPLGDAPGSLAPTPTPPPGAAGTAGAAAGAAAGTAAGAAPPAGGKAAPDTCWRVQVAAPKNAEEADQKRSAAESLLMTGFVVERDGAFYKVRSRDCLSREDAARLRDRALASGFAGTFPFAIVKS